MDVLVIDKSGDMCDLGYTGCDAFDLKTEIGTYRGDIGSKPFYWWKTYATKEGKDLRQIIYTKHGRIYRKVV